MKILPKNKQAWLRLLSLPFKTYVLGYGLLYPVWLFSMPGRPGTIGGPDYSIIEKYAVGYFISSLALIIIAIIQALTKDRKDAVWTVVFAVLALFFAATGTLHPSFR
ncbi:MAG: hypothetical protein ACLP2Y_08840 [Limisphaerales bacterium]